MDVSTCTGVSLNVAGAEVTEALPPKSVQANAPNCGGIAMNQRRGWLGRVCSCSYVIVIALGFGAAHAGSAGSGPSDGKGHDHDNAVNLRVLSSPAQYVSGGDARIEVRAAPGLHGKIQLYLNGRPIKPALRSDGRRL